TISETRMRSPERKNTKAQGRVTFGIPISADRILGSRSPWHAIMTSGRARVTHRLLLDVSSMMYRAFFAMREPGVFTKDGRPVGAVHGYLDMVTRLINDRNPDEVVHVYDHDWRPVARTDIYADYKGNRLPDPEGLPPQFEILRDVLDLTGLLQAQ